jgi:hypothetical protein
MFRIQSTVFVIALVCSLSGCTQKESSAGAPSLTEQAKGHVDTAKAKASEMSADFAAKRAEYTQVAEKKLAALDQKLGELRVNASEATGDAKVELEKLVDSLSEERKAVGAKLGELKDTSADAWASFTQKLDSSLGALEQSIEKAFSKK